MSTPPNEICRIAHQLNSAALALAAEAALIASGRGPAARACGRLDQMAAQLAAQVDTIESAHAALRMARLAGAASDAALPGWQHQVSF